MAANIGPQQGEVRGNLWGGLLPSQGMAGFLLACCYLARYICTVRPISFRAPQSHKFPRTSPLLGSNVGCHVSFYRGEVG